VSRASPARPAYLLHRWDWSESSLVVELFVRDAGRVVVVARGAKKPTSNFRPVLLPFQRLAVVLARPASPDSEIHGLKAAEWGGALHRLEGGALFEGFYVNELVMKALAREDAHPPLWDAYAATLARLHGADDGARQAALRAFELVLLRETGVLPALDLTTAAATAVRADASYVIDADAGLALAAPGAARAMPGALLLALEPALANADAEALATHLAHAPPPVRAALREVLRGWLAQHVAPRRLATREVLAGVRRLGVGRTAPVTGSGRPGRAAG
jgi:DNA repair protein RecO (recombination protein O)